MEIQSKLLKEIDSIELSPANKAWRKAMKSAPWCLHADRERWTVASWEETEGLDLEIRRAKLLEKVLENLEITVLPFDKIVGRVTPTVIGCITSMDVSGDYIPAIWNDEEVDLTMDASVSLDKESLSILRKAAETFRGKTAPEMTAKAWEAAVGDWAKNAESAKLKDPSIDTAVFGQVTTALDWPKILTVGLKGYIEEAEGKIEAFKAGNDTDIDKLYFWQAVIIVLNAVITFSRRYAVLARNMAADEADDERRAELFKIAEICEYVPENPPRTFHEALQAMAICGAAKCLEHPMHCNPHWGRADHYLYRFFINDINAGRITVAKAAELLADLIGRWGTQCMVQPASQKLSHQINFGINNIMVGGVNAAGEDVCNELSYLILHVVGLLKISSPTVGLKWSKKTPDWMMDKAIRTNLATRGGIPLFENDDAIIEHYVRDGIPYEEAVEWCGLGCVYPCLPTRAEHTGAHGLGAFNVCGMLWLAMHDGVDINGNQTGLKTGNVREFKNFEELYDAFLKQHKFFSHRIFRLGPMARDLEGEYLRLPLISVLALPAAMELGQDNLKPHPDFALQGIGDRAIVDTGDCLFAVKHLVFDEKVLTMSELMDALDNNFEGERGEEIRQLCLHAPKFGNDDSRVDEMVKRVSDDSGRIIHEYDNTPFRPIMIAREGLAWHYFGGLGLGATPNGRKAFEPLCDGSASPMRGQDKNGPTAVLRSVINAGFKDAYACVLNQKINASIVKSEEGVKRLIEYTNAFMGAGGTHIQYNIVDSEELKEAKEKPTEYTDLIVRIGGYSAYFIQLSGEIQDDVICRSEFAV